jgi:hypothetical protein
VDPGEGCLMQVPPLQARLYEVTVIGLGPVKVELVGLTKSTWKSNSLNEVVEVPISRKWLGAPAAGAEARHPDGWDE